MLHFANRIFQNCNTQKGYPKTCTVSTWIDQKKAIHQVTTLLPPPSRLTTAFLHFLAFCTLPPKKILPTLDQTSSPPPVSCTVSGSFLPERQRWSTRKVGGSEMYLPFLFLHSIKSRVAYVCVCPSTSICNASRRIKNLRRKRVASASAGGDGKIGTFRLKEKDVVHMHTKREKRVVSRIGMISREESRRFR